MEAGGGSNGGGAAGTIDGMATEQGMYAAVAYKRLLSGKTSLYDMSDLSLSPGKAPKAPPVSTETTKKKVAASKIKVTKITLNKNKLFLNKGKTATIKATVSPSGAGNKTLKWSSSNSKIVTVSSRGKVKGVKGGTAVITAKAADGSGVKAVCKVIVSSPSSTATSGKGNTDNKSASSGSSSSSSTTAYTPTTWSSTTAVEKETGEDEEESTETQAWSFGGSDYRPDGDSQVPQADGALWESSDFEDYEESTNLEDPYSLGMGNRESGKSGTPNLPLWLSLFLGLAIPAALAGLVAAPWDKIPGKRKSGK